MVTINDTGGEKLQTTNQPRKEGRILLEGDTTQLITELEQIFHPRPHQEHLDRITKTLSVMFRENQVSIETALEVIATFQLNLETLHQVYNHDLTAEEEAETLSLQKLLKIWGVPGDMARQINRNVNKIIEPPRHYGLIVGSLGTDSNILINPQTEKVYYELVNIKNDKDYSKRYNVINAYPTNVTVYDSPITDEPRKFKITWKTKRSPRPIITGPDLIEDIKVDMITNGYVTGNRYANDVFPGIVNLYLDQGLAELKTDIETPGFFYNTEKDQVIAVNFEVTNPSMEEVRSALNILEELSTYYPGREDKLSFMWKWSLISPFIYAMKQRGNWTPWPFLYGQPKSGKSVLGQLALYIWSEPGIDNDLTGSGFDTVARVGGKISQSTFPIVVNEPGGAFQRVSITEMIKGAIEKTVSRGRYEGRRYRNIPSFNPVIFTSNQFMPNDGALARRLSVHHFTYLEKRSESERKQFEEDWQIRNPKRCKFNLFKPVSLWVAHEITQDPSLLEVEWKELCDLLMNRLYADAEMEPPKWIFEWGELEGMEDLDLEQQEDIRIFLQDQINRAYGRVQIIDHETGKTQDSFNYTNKLKETSKFKERVWHVVNERLIPWIVPLEKNNKKYICFTMGFKKEVHKELKVCQPLKGIAELLGWKYQTVRLPEPTMVIKVSFDKFLSFIYPGEVES